MRRTVAALLIVAAASSLAFGASARWNCLGRDHRFMLDTSNYGIYPSRMLMFSDAMWIIPSIRPTGTVPNDMMAGLLVNRGDEAWAIHYNMPGPIAFGALRSALSQSGSGGAFAGLAGDLRPMPDVFYARKVGEMTVGGRVVLGLASSEPLADKSASAMSLDLAGGITTPLSAGDLDVGARLGVASFSNDAQNIESTGGMAFAVDSRLLMKRGNGATLIPVAGLSFSSDPTVDGGTEVSHMGADVGLGCNRIDAKKNMLVYGATLAYSSTSYTPPTGSDSNTHTIEFAYLTGYEKVVNKWAKARGGARGTITSVGGDDTSANGTCSDFYYNFGTRVEYQRVLLDVQMDKALLHRGPYFLTGSGADWGANVCLTLLLEPAN
jgi:hypothetical protein